MRKNMLKIILLKLKLNLILFNLLFNILKLFKYLI